MDSQGVLPAPKSGVHHLHVWSGCNFPHRMATTSCAQAPRTRPHLSAYSATLRDWNKLYQAALPKKHGAKEKLRLRLHERTKRDISRQLQDN